MYATLSSEVYLVQAGAGEGDGGQEERPFLTDESEDAPVVIGIGMKIEEMYARNGSHRIDDPRNSRRVTALAEVWDGFEKHLSYWCCDDRSTLGRSLPGVSRSS